MASESMPCMVLVAEHLAIRADQVATIKRNSFGAIEIKLEDGVVWNVDGSVSDLAAKVNSALQQARAAKDTTP